MRKREIEELKTKLNLLKSNAMNSIRYSNDTIDTLNSISTSEEADIGSFQSIAYVDENILKNNNIYLESINRAIKKIENNKYGKCEMCNKNIDIRRLRAKPYARFCISCREVYEKQKSKNKKDIKCFINTIH